MKVCKISAFGKLRCGEAAEGEGFFDEFAVWVREVEVGNVLNADDFEAGGINVFGEVGDGDKLFAVSKDVASGDTWIKVFTLDLDEVFRACGEGNLIADFAGGRVASEMRH